MSDIQYKMVVFDLDGTIVTEGFEILPNTKKVIESIRADLGLRVSVATGRMYGSALPYTSQLLLKEPVIYTNGAIYDCILTKQRKIYAAIPHEIALFVVQLLSKIKLSAKFHFENESILKSDDSPWPNEGKHFTTGVVAKNLRKELLQAPLKIVFYGEEKAILEYEAELKLKFGKDMPVRIFKSHEHYMEMTHLNVSKANAIRKAFEPLDISIEECITVGDQDNDFEMIRDAGYGIVAGKGNSSLNAVSKFKIPSPEDRGIEALLEHLKTIL